ncbi:MAG: flavodoxin family protein [Prevotella sp.]|nr:flavodoxin family protein [Prevotella sp.]
MSKVLLFNCSPHKSGNTFLALEEVAAELHKEGIETETLHIGTKAVRGCIACNSCKKEGADGCVFDDDVMKVRANERNGVNSDFRVQPKLGVVNNFARKAATADGFVIGSPVYYGLPTGQCIALVQRMFVSAGDVFRFKPVANVAVCRRGGATAALEAMNMPWMMMNCPVVSSSYWNIVYGHQPGEAQQDAEGMQVMRNLARNLARLLRGLAAEPAPQLDTQQRTNYRASESK